MDNEASNQVPLGPGLSITKSTLRFRFARSGGPGGQNVNKVNTKATLSVRIDDLGKVLDATTIVRLRLLAGRYLVDDQLQITSDESRSQWSNRQVCLSKLRQLIGRAKKLPPMRKPTRPSRAANERRLQQKAQRSQVKRRRQDQPRVSDE